MYKHFTFRDRLRKHIHPYILKSMPSRRDFSLTVLNEMPTVSNNKIFVMNHSTVYDAPVASEVIKEHFYILVAKQSLALIDRLFFLLNGVVYIDRKDAKSKEKGMEQMEKIIRRGNNLLLYPEGTWNRTPSKPMLPLNWGVIELAKRTQVPIIPIVAEFTAESCYIMFGDEMYVNYEADKKAFINYLEDIMATMRWDIWERTPIQKRTDSMKKEFKTMMQKRVDACPKADSEYEFSVIRGRENDPEYVFGKRN